MATDVPLHFNKLHTSSIKDNFVGIMSTKILVTNVVKHTTLIWNLDIYCNTSLQESLPLFSTFSNL